MRKKQQRTVREQARLILAIAASNGCGTWAAEEWLGLSQTPAAELASAAFLKVLPSWQRWLGPNRKPRPVYAEAEALLRCRWSP